MTEKRNSIGALWAKTAKSGMSYLSGVIEINGEKISIVCFPNEKKSDKQPDFRILLSEKPSVKEESVNVPF